MIEESATRFNNGDWYHMKIDTDVPDCEVTGFLDGIPVSFFGECEAGLIEGGIVVWNQGVPAFVEENYLNEINVTSEYDSDGIIVSCETGNSNGVYSAQLFSTVEDHKYLVSIDVKSENEYPSISFGARSATGVACSNISTVGMANEWIRTTKIVSAILTQDNSRIYAFRTGGNYENIHFRNGMIIDLTKMFGAEIADMIYSLEQTTAGSGVALFKTLFAPDDYYNYNAGENMRITLRETE